MNKIFFVLYLCVAPLLVGACANAAMHSIATPTHTAPESPTVPEVVVTAIPVGPVRLEVIPKKLRYGMRATMVGHGFERGEPVAFYFIRPDGTKTAEGESTADKSGGVAYKLDVMEDWQPGQYVARVQSKKNPSRRAEQKIELLLR
jgi:hypothetical protein